MRSALPWREAKLGAVAAVDRRIVSADSIQNGSNYVGLEHIDAEGKITNATVDAGDLRSSKHAFSERHVLYGKLRPYLRKIARPMFSGVCSTDILPILPGPDVDRDYLFYLLRQPRMISLAIARSEGVNLPRLSPGTLLEFPVSLPPLAEQRRVAAILDKADAIRLKFRDCLRLAEGLPPSGYPQLVGERHPDYQHWPEYSIEDLAEPRHGALRTGPFGSALRHAEFRKEGEVAVFGIDNVVANRFRWGESRFISRERYERDLKRYAVGTGDVLITIMGTTGRSVVVPSDIGLAISTKHLATISVNRRLVLPEFLSCAIHSDPMVIRQIRSASRGAIMAGLNLGIIRRLRLRLPPMAQQERFVAAVDQATRLEARFEEANGLSAALLQCLSDAAFNRTEKRLWSPRSLPPVLRESDNRSA